MKGLIIALVLVTTSLQAAKPEYWLMSNGLVYTPVGAIFGWPDNKSACQDIVDQMNKVMIERDNFHRFSCLIMDEE